MKILIVGGGIAGLTLARFLKKFDLAEVTLVEQAPEFHNIGYLIGFWGNGRRVMRELGLDESITEKNGYEISWNIIKDKHGKLLKAFPIDPFKKFGKTVVMRRSDLHRGLVDGLRGVDIRLGISIVKIQQGAQSVQIGFSSGKNESFDLVVGADGLHSSVREQVFGKGFFKYHGWGVWMYWLPEKFEHQQEATAMIGEGKICALLPFYKSCVATLVAKVPRGTGQSAGNKRDELLKLFSNFGKTAREIIDAAPDEHQIYYDDVAHVNMPTWHKGRVVLMGDAQHAVSPVTGMGASMAMEDAFVLAQELKENRNDIGVAIRRYVVRREKRIQKFRSAVNRMDQWIMAGGFVGGLRDIILPLIPSSFFLKGIRNLLETKA